MTMSQSRASGAPITATLGGHRRTLRRLSRRDFGVLMDRVPVKDDARTYITPFQVHRWSATVAGAASVIAIASLPADYTPQQFDERLADIERDDGTWGSMTQQSTVASLVTAESLLTGEEPADEPSGDEQGSDPTSTGVTTATKPG